MITKRIIPCLDVRNGEVVKGVNFEGLRSVASPVDLARCYSEAGADELDLVVNQRLLKYAPKVCAAELQQWVRTCRTLRSDLVLKLILECCNLTKAEIARGCRIARRVGFDFVKTSTGFGPGGATAEDVALMRRVVGPEMGVKAAGGIRDAATARAMVAAGATRIGTSAGMNML